MKGSVKGVQAKVKELISPKALYVHCSSHSFNLALTDACKIPDIRNTFQSLNEVIKFIRASPKRTSTLKNITAENPTHYQRDKLISFCETRFVERHSSVLRFVELYDAIVDLLEILEIDADSNTSSKAHQLLICITTIRFVVSMYVIEKVLSITISFSRQLQSPDLVLLACLEMAENILVLLTDIQLNSTTEFAVEQIWKVAATTCTNQSVPVDLPRSAKIKLKKNPQDPGNTMDAETYYRTTIFDPFLECD